MDVIRPYKGKEDYIAVGFCKQDQERVFAIVAELIQSGYRVWYARENDYGPDGESDKQHHIKKCSLYLALLSDAAVNSHAFRQDLNTAVRGNCPVVSIELSPVQEMSPGMKLQLEIIPKIELQHGEEPRITEYLQKLGMLREELQETTDEAGVRKEVHYLYREKNDEHILLSGKKNKLGRSDKLCQCVIQDNCTVGREHAVIYVSDEMCRLVDNHSYNGTFLNGQRLEPGKAYALKHGDRIILSNEEFIFQTVNKSSE